MFALAACNGFHPKPKMMCSKKLVAVNLAGGTELALDEGFASFALLCLFGGLERMRCWFDRAAGQDVWSWEAYGVGREDCMGGRGFLWKRFRCCSEFRN